MGFVTGDNYNPALVPALQDFELMFEKSKDAKLEEMLNGVDEINKQDVVDRMQQFSCQEELERYIHKKELPRNV